MGMPPRTFVAIAIISSMIFPTYSSKRLMGNETDRRSLLAFKAAISDPLHALSSWSDSTHFCEWSGVTCGRRHRRVTVLLLNSSRLGGSLSPHIGNLSFLKILYLPKNSFSGDIPQELGRLHRLKILVLSNNTFSGEIPINMSRCSNLQVFFLSGNNLKGKLPPELGLLSKLRSFVFARNKISGKIPHSLGNLSSLEIINGQYNSLSGSIPDSFGKLKQLTFFGFGANRLTGVIPSSLYNLSSLNTFSVPFNQLEGTLPSNLGLLLPNLVTLILDTNHLSGTIPTTISNSSKLWMIDMNTNNFLGEVPSLVGLNNLAWVLLSENHLGNNQDEDLNFLYDLVNCSKIEHIGIADNNYGGLLPECISNFSITLRRIEFGWNRIQGPIHSGIGNLIGLQSVGMEDNRLTGTVPSSLSKLPNLQELYLDYNELSGSIPSSLGNLTSLLAIHLEHNNLIGSIQASLGNLRNLLVMGLSENKLSGTIPREIMSLSSLSKYLNLSNNQLTGSIPMEVGKLVNLGIISLSHNKLTGEIPRTMGSCISLETLYLHGNLLHGEVPLSFSSLRAIQNLDLSRNNLSGKIPTFLSGLGLKYLNLSFNDFEGEVPAKGVFMNASAVSLQGNKKLCGGMLAIKLPRCIYIRSKRRKASTKLRTIIIVVSSGSGLLLLGLILLFSFLASYQTRKTRNKTVSAFSMEISYPRTTYGDLFKATDGFSPGNLIGLGGFGSVYKGNLCQEGEAEKEVAVKVLNLQQKGALRSFMTECEALRNIRHRNLVKTLTVCSSTDFVGNDFKALIYELMVNGSLEQWLHQVQREDPSQETPRCLDLSQRLNIAIDVANALEYLHNQCSQPIVHGDLKPSNVLLDEDMTARIGDFGLARLLPEAFDHSSLNQTSSAGFRGSIGYAAPEYATGGVVSTRGDIYSFGIILLEMFTGKRPTDEMFKDGLNIHGFVDAALPDGFPQALDPILLQEREVRDPSSSTSQNRNRTRDADRVTECLVLIFRTGLACSAEMPGDRMNITDVVAQLSSIRDKLNAAVLRRRL